jgi:HlyD family secretion protein
MMNELFAFVVALLASVVPGIGNEPETVFTGYLEAEYIYAAAAMPGRLIEITVEEGESVGTGDVLFSLEADQQRALLAAAEARVAAARATLENLETGSRSAEIEVIRASLAKAEADLALAQSTLARSERLFEAGTVSEARLEQDRAAVASARAQVAQLQAEVQVAELPARNAQQVAAEANLAAAEAEAEKARLDLADRTVKAAVAGTVEQVYFAPGEMVPAGTPVVSIRPAGALLTHFFVDETARATLALGEEVTVSCDGCPDGLTAEITWMASDPQTTPPVIYSREERSRLVYLAKAQLADPGTLLPGQPVTVRPAP